jgi:hypothetical protein
MQSLKKEGIYLPMTDCGKEGGFRQFHKATKAIPEDLPYLSGFSVEK